MKILPSSISFNANKMSKRQAKYFREQLKKSKSVDIICHESTDRDSLNSAIVMQSYMDSLGVNSRVIVSQEHSKLGITKPIFRYITSDKINKNTEPPDTVLCLDFSAKERVQKNILDYIKKSKNILCIDHHNGTNLFNKDYIVIRDSIDNSDKIIETSVPCYVDSSAVSATSVIYRFFEALNKPVNNAQAFSLMYGFVDDGTKKGYFVCDGVQGAIIPTQKLIDDEKGFEIYVKLSQKIKKEQIKKIAQNIDVLSNLSEDEKKFKNSLYNRMEYSKNGKIAYVEIPPDDKQWMELGGDNSRTSAILNRFRQNILKDFKDIEAVFVFYEAEGRYKLSVHSSSPTLLDFFNYIEKTRIPNFTKNAGGHKERAGGKIFTIDPVKCHKWVEDIISCADFYDKDM